MLQHRPGPRIDTLGATMQVEGTRMYRVRDVAEHFDVSVATIYRAIEAGQLDALKLGTGKGTLRVTGAAVAAYARACTQTAYDSLENARASSNNPERLNPAQAGVWAEHDDHASCGDLAAEAAR